MSESQEASSEATVLDPSAKSPRKSGTRNAFPRIPISKVLPLVEAIWTEGQGDQVRTTAAFARLGKSHKSGPSRTLIAAANSGYGFITGSFQTPMLSLTEPGKVIGRSNTGAERKNAILDAVFKNDTFRAVYEKYLNRSLPTDQVIADFIKFDRGLSEEDSISAWSVIGENLRYLDLLTKEGNAEVIIERTQAAVPIRAERFTNQDEESDIPFKDPGTQPPVKVGGVTTMLPADFHFNIQIHLPSDASPEVYDAIFSSIAKNLMLRDV